MSCVLELRDDIKLWQLIHELQENIKDYKKVYTLLLKYRNRKIGTEARKVANKVLKDIPRFNKSKNKENLYEGIVTRLIDVWNNNENVRYEQFKIEG